MLILNLLGINGDLGVILSCWVGFLTTDYLGHKLNLDILVSFLISPMIGFVVIMFIIGLLNINS